MANTTSGTYIFDKNYAIDDVIMEAYERIGLSELQEIKLDQLKDL